MSDTADSLISQIRSAFVNVPRLSDELMFIGSQDKLWIYSYLGRNEEWPDIPVEIIDSETYALTDVTPEGFQYLLPAYMVRTLSEPNSNAADNTIYALDITGHTNNLRDIMIKRFEILSAPQKETVTSFLKWATNNINVDNFVAKRALESYWGKNNRGIT